MDKITFDVSVVIVNYNTADLIVRCLHSLLKQCNVNFEIIIVDNHSQDNSIEIIQPFCNEKVKLITNQQNKGFGAANNQAFKESDSRYIYMLNPDACCLTTLDLLHLYNFMEMHPEIGLAGTKMVNEEQQPVPSMFHHYPRQREVKPIFKHLPGDWASALGASMFARRSALALIDYFDERFFLYAEETDLCLRLRKAGYEIGFCEDVTVCHQGGASEKGSSATDVLLKKKSGKFLFYQKHYLTKDLLKLVNHDYRVAKFRISYLNLLKTIYKLNDEQLEKYKRYTGIISLCQNILVQY